MAFTTQFKKLSAPELNLIKNVLDYVKEKHDITGDVWSELTLDKYDNLHNKTKRKDKVKKKSPYHLFTADEKVRQQIKQDFPDEEHTLGFISKK